MEDHIHMLTDLHPSIALANFVRDIKSNSSFHLKNHKQFLNFKGWADGYAALTYTWRDKDLIINYIKNQQKHHQQETFHDEYQKLLKTHGLHLENEYTPPTSH